MAGAAKPYAQVYFFLGSGCNLTLTPTYLLPTRSESDFTIFFRELSNAADSTDSLAALLVLQRSFPQPEESETTKRTSSSSAMPSLNVRNMAGIYNMYVCMYVCM